MRGTSGFSLLLAGAAFALCAAAQVMAGADKLAGSEWRPVEVAGDTLAGDNGLFVRFEANDKVAGHGGCNRFFGTYRIGAADLAIGPLASTRKACQPAIMAREAAFMAALERTRLFLRDGTKLTLKDAQGVTVLRLAQTDWD